MRISENERQAIRATLEYAEQHGYGNLISHLQTAWAARLMRGGLSEKAARLASGGRGYSFALQNDLIERGEWDETGARYATAKSVATRRKAPRSSTGGSPRQTIKQRRK